MSGETTPLPTVSVNSGYLAAQSVDDTTPERTESWMSAVCAVPPPGVHATQTTSVWEDGEPGHPR